ncbi:MAG: thiamine pyrophosphate-dependent enzyme [Lautropia sp.]
MAERSFAREVEKLKLGAGQTFSGEGILAVTKALLQSGVAYVAGYQGAPISHLMDVLADAQDILGDMGVRFEHSASEATAAATLAASVNYPLRGAVTFKSTVGTNVASDALANLASGGVTGGALIIVGEDYGDGSSIMQERSHAFAMKSQIWLLDPRPNLPSIVAAVETGFELSEASRTPVMLELRIRACHVHGSFVAKDNRRPGFTLAQAMEQPRRDVSRIVLPPASFLHEREKVEDRWPAAVAFIEQRRINEFFGGADGAGALGSSVDDADQLGIIVQGGLYNTLLRALERLGLADVFGESRVPLYVLNVTYPLIPSELTRFCAGKRAVLVVEEGQPDYLEQAITTELRRADLQTRVVGKGPLPMAGEYTSAVLVAGIRRFVEAQSPGLLPAGVGAASAGAAAPAFPGAVGAPGAPGTADSGAPNGSNGTHGAPLVATPIARPRPVIPIAELDAAVHARPPGFCTGCPERPIFSALKLVQRELGEHHVSADIGCHLFSILPPFHIGNTTMGYGLGGAGAAALNAPAGKRAISVMGDGGFWHNGLTSGVANAVFNKSDNLTLIIDNNYTAATGGQDILSSRAVNKSRSTAHPIEAAVRGVGVGWVRTIRRTYDVAGMRDALREALTSKEKGPKVIVAQSECMLNRQRREKPLVRAAIAAGERSVRERFGVDPDTCTGDHSCIRLSGCPSLSITPNRDPLRQDPVVRVEDSCVGCGLCGEVSHAAVLCPSFYRASIVSNPTRFDRFRARLRERVIGWLQRRIARRLAATTLGAA